MLGGQVGVTGHVRIGKGAMASAKTGITGNVEPGVLVSGLSGAAESRLAQDRSARPSPAGAQEARRRARTAHRRTRGEARRMPDTDGSLMRRAALAACLFLTAVRPRASAQYAEPPGFAPAPASPDFLTRYDFHLSASKLAVSTPDNLPDGRFVWDTHFGGDLDVVDYVVRPLVDAGRLRGGARQRIPRRSIPIRATTRSKRPPRPRGRRHGDRRRLPSRVAASRAIGRSVSRSRGTCSARACCAASTWPGDHRSMSTVERRAARSALVRRLHVDRRISIC